MLSEVSDKYSGDYSVNVPEEMKFPTQIQYGQKHKHLNPMVKKLKLRSSGDYNHVNRFLERLERVGIATDEGNDNIFRAVRIQLHSPRNFNDSMFRHQIASYMVEIVDFLFPIMKNYLEQMKISFNTYVMGVYNGRIWGDEYVLATIGKMFNIRISVISPFYTDIWNVFHDGAREADVILITNSTDFGSGKYQVSHFSATKGIGEKWKCIGADIQLKDIGLYVRETDGQHTAVDLFNINENLLLQGTKKAVNAINDLCVDIENICINRDKVLDDLKTLNVRINNFKRFTSYYIKDDYDGGLQQSKRRGTMPPAKKVTEVVPSSSRAIPKIRLIDSRGTDFGQQLIAEALELIDDEHELAQIHSLSKKAMKTTDVEKVPVEEKGDVTEESLEEGEIRDKVDRVQEHFVSVETSLQKSKKRKSKLEIMEKSTDTERRRKRSKEVVEKSAQPKRCRVKMPMIGRPKPCDIPPSLPSLGMYTDYVNEEDTINTMQTVHTFQSSVPLEGEIVIHPVVYDDDVETTDVIDVDTEMDVQNAVSDVQSFK